MVGSCQTKNRAGKLSAFFRELPAGGKYTFRRWREAERITEEMSEEKPVKKERRSDESPRLSRSTIILDHLFLNFFLNPASPTNPEARSSMVAGSGTDFEPMFLR
jgi:hypothetical protein